MSAKATFRGTCDLLELQGKPQERRRAYLGRMSVTSAAGHFTVTSNWTW